jgi:hypothetical protein
MPTLIANLALEITPIRVNLIAAGPLSASILGGRLSRQCRSVTQDIADAEVKIACP